MPGSIVAMMPRRILLGSLLAITGWASGAPPATETLDLFSDPEFAGWSVVAANAADIRSICSRTTDGTIALTGTPTGYLLTDATYENFVLRLEYRWPADAAPKSNGGILLHIVSGPVAPAAWPTCIQLQTKVQNAGDLLQMFGATFTEPVTSPAKGNVPPLRARQQDASERPFGEWNIVEIGCLRGMIEVRINGVLQNRVTGAEPHAGRIGIQLEGAPFELRHVRLLPIPATE